MRSWDLKVELLGQQPFGKIEVLYVWNDASCRNQIGDSLDLKRCQVQIMVPINKSKIHSLETNIAPENRPSQKETSPTIHFRCYVSFREGNYLDVKIEQWPFWTNGFTSPLTSRVPTFDLYTSMDLLIYNIVLEISIWGIRSDSAMKRWTPKDYHPTAPNIFIRGERCQ